MSTAHPLWDLPVRIIHWSIVILLPASWWTAEEGYLEQHQWLGITLLILVLTRLAWGFVGSAQARFGDFLRGPGTAIAYMRGAPSPTPGHNPLGGWSAMVLWLLLLAQAATGLFNGDDVLFDGPFHFVFDSDVTDTLGQLHEILFNVMLGFVGLHIAAIVFYERVRRQRVLRPMITGVTPDRQGTGPAEPFYKALVIAALWGLLLWWLMGMAPEPAPSYW